MSTFSDPEIFRSILESLPTGLCVVDMEKRIVLWSDGAENITGHLRHEVIGHSCIGERLLHCDQPGCEFCSEDCPAARAMKTAHPIEALSFLEHKAGHEILARVRAVPVHNAHGSIIGAVEIFEDQQSCSLDQRADSLTQPGCADEITGIASRTMMQFYLRETLSSFTELQVPFCVLCFRLEGLDHFRAAFGPEAAPALLRVVARTLERGIGKGDFAGRWADDQFLVILNGCREEALHSVRERLRRMLSNDSIEWWGDRLTLPFSIGQAAAQQGDSVETLMGRVMKSLEASSAALLRRGTVGQSSGS